MTQPSWFPIDLASYVAGLQGAAERGRAELACGELLASVTDERIAASLEPILRAEWIEILNAVIADTFEGLAMAVYQQPAAGPRFFGAQLLILEAMTRKVEPAEALAGLLSGTLAIDAALRMLGAGPRESATPASAPSADPAELVAALKNLEPVQREELVRAIGTLEAQIAAMPPLQPTARLENELLDVVIAARKAAAARFAEAVEPTLIATIAAMPRITAHATNIPIPHPTSAVVDPSRDQFVEARFVVASTPAQLHAFYIYWHRRDVWPITHDSPDRMTFARGTLRVELAFSAVSPTETALTVRVKAPGAIEYRRAG